MQNDKETKASSRWQKWRQSPNFFKNLLSYSILILVFFMSVFFLLYRSINKTILQNELLLQNVYPAPEPAAVPETVAIENELAQQNNRLTNVENAITEQQLPLQTSYQLIAFEILEEILEGRLPLKCLADYLQKNAHPWTIDILNRLSPIAESKTYDQLQALLILPPLPQPSSLWQRLKNLLKVFVHIRKLDAAGNYMVGDVDAIRTALRGHNIQQALEAFDKLSLEEQQLLSSWKQEAQNRLTLELIRQSFILELLKD